MLDSLIPKCRSRSRTTPGTILLAILAVAMSWAAHGKAAPEDGLAARWTFDGTLTACAGDAMALTARGLQGEPATARFVTAEQLPGTSGQAVALGVGEGDAQWLTAPVSDALRLGPEYTIELWVHPVHLATWGRLVLRWGGVPRYAYHVAIRDGRASLYHNQSSGEYLCHCPENARIDRAAACAGASKQPRRLDSRRPSEGISSVVLPFQGNRLKTTSSPGRRSALPWADLLQPLRGKETRRHPSPAAPPTSSAGPGAPECVPRTA